MTDPRPSERFPRAFRLKRRRLIKALFSPEQERGTLAVGCIRLVYRWASPEEVGLRVPVQVAFAPGRRVRKAVRRNRIRRLLRETYRRHQHLLLEHLADRAGTLTLMILFRGQPEEAERCIPRDLPRALERLAEQFAREF